MRILPWTVACCLCCYSLPQTVESSSEPHPHVGVVKPFRAGDPGVTLNRAALAVLESGKPYYQTQTTIQDGTSVAGQQQQQRGLVVQDIHAPVETVWGRILDFDHYHMMVPKTIESQTYKVETIRGGKKRIFVRMKVAFPVPKLQFFLNHVYDPSNNSLTWTLDYAHRSDLDDSAGYWYVIPHPDKNHSSDQWTRVYYAVDVVMFPWMPQFAVDFFSGSNKQALTDATAWVKKYSELEVAAAASAVRHPSEAFVKESKSFVDGGGEGALEEALRSPQTRCNGLVQNSMIRRWLLLQGKQGSDGDTCTAASDEMAAATAVRPIGLMRYFLVASVFSLSMYNIHLYFSR